MSQAAHHHDQLISAIDRQSPEMAVEISRDHALHHWAQGREDFERAVWPDRSPDVTARRVKGNMI